MQLLYSLDKLDMFVMFQSNVFHVSVYSMKMFIENFADAVSIRFAVFANNDNKNCRGAAKTSMQK